MALRFRTRLTLMVSALVFLSVTAMTIVVVGILAWNLNEQYFHSAEILHQLTNENIAYGVALPKQVMDRLDGAIVVQGLLISELVALAEKPGPSGPDEIRDALLRVKQRSADLYGFPLVTEFWITDETGKAYITTSDRAFDFGTAVDDSSQAGEFRKLLEPGAKPIVQPLRERALDGQKYKYVGVTGADKPRIIQVGLSEFLVEVAVADFQIQGFVERFMPRSEFNRLAVVSQSGDIIASVSRSTTEPPKIEDAIVRKCQSFLQTGRSGPEYQQIGFEIGVITRIDAVDGTAYALFIEHRVVEKGIHILRQAGVVALVGLGLIVFGVLVGVVFSGGMAKPIVALSRGAAEFGKGNLNYRMYVKRKDEFQGLAQAFNTMAISLQEYMHELEQETSRRERLESEFRIAADIQQALLPQAPPEVDGLEMLGWSRPSREVGGDFYDFLKLDDGRVIVALGDAAGKGISAALLITQLSGILRTLAGELSEPSDLLYRTNIAFHKRIERTHMFVTLCLMLIDPRKGTLKISLAGHPPPMIANARSARGQEVVAAGPGYPLGIVEDAEFSQIEVTLKPGDTILVYSDGFTDAQNNESEMYGDERLQAAFIASGHKPIGEVVMSVREDAELHMSGREPFDDMTLVAFRFTSVAEEQAA
ncbi:MAG: SpoIIE family protein phosphatase [Candidatus Hydrogenedentota bacterium]